MKFENFKDCELAAWASIQDQIGMVIPIELLEAAIKEQFDLGFAHSDSYHWAEYVNSANPDQTPALIALEAFMTCVNPKKGYNYFEGWRVKKDGE